MDKLKKSIESMRSHKVNFWIFMDRITSDNKLIIVGVCILALTSGEADVYKYVVGGLIGFMTKDYLDEKKEEGK